MFGKVEIQMAKDRAALEKSYIHASAIGNANNKLTSLIALSDSRFRKTVKDIEKTKALARKQVADAKKYYKAELYALMART